MKSVQIPVFKDVDSAVYEAEATNVTTRAELDGKTAYSSRYGKGAKFASSLKLIKRIK